jgi:hypothetical protein
VSCKEVYLTARYLTMALSISQLAAGIGPQDLILTLTSLAGFPAVGTVLSGNGQPVQVDNELMFVANVLNATQVKVRMRGSDGTVAVAHDVNAPVVTSASPGDFPAVPFGQFVLHPPAMPETFSYGADGALRIPLKDAKALITKPSAGAFTLAAPSLANGTIEYVITSTTAFAHVITTVSLFDTGAAGSPFNTATFPAQLGASLSLLANPLGPAGALWNVTAVQGAVVFT